MKADDTIPNLYASEDSKRLNDCVRYDSNRVYTVEALVSHHLGNSKSDRN